MNKKALDDTLARRMFVVPSFEIHGGVAGLYDYGPPGAALKENVLAAWRQHFVLEDNMLQIECTTLTPHAVLKTSGHVDRFEDLMVKDTKNGECYRADKLLEDAVEAALAGDAAMPPERREELRRIAAQADAFSPAELHAHLTALGVKSPSSGAELTEPFPFNLMFATSIGPAGNSPGFLRPETAQGMFVNFRRLYDYNNGRMPMAVAQVGTAYRNEIAPKGGLIRVREFTMAEIEYFVNPAAKQHAKFESVAALRLNLFPADRQVGDGTLVTPTLGDAVASGLVNNQTLGYFMGRTALFLYKIGIKPEGLRFRQHLKTEMAHYACDCWDAEILMAQGWVECVGHADRSAYDLQVHAKVTKVDMVAKETLPEVVEEEFVVAKLTKKAIAAALKADVPAVVAALEELAAERGDEALALGAALARDGAAPLALPGSGKTVTVTKEMVSFAKETRRVQERKYVPNVIEPSFGIGRILTGVWEHVFYTRGGDEQKAVLAFAPAIAPYKAVVLPLDGRIDRRVGAGVAQALSTAGLAAYTDDSGASVGRRYARADEVGVPFAITVDFDTATDGAVTMRERDSTAQVRLPLADVLPVVRALVGGETAWADVAAKYGLLAAPAAAE